MNSVPYNEVNEPDEEITQEEVAKAMKELPELPELPPKVLTPEEQEGKSYTIFIFIIICIVTSILFNFFFIC